MAQKFVLALQAASREEGAEFLRALKREGFDVTVGDLPGDETGLACPGCPDPATIVEVMGEVFLETDPPASKMCAFLDAGAEMAGCPIAFFSPDPGRTGFSCKASSRLFPRPWTLWQLPAGTTEIPFDRDPNRESSSFPLDGNDLSAGILVAYAPGGHAKALLETLARVLGKSLSRAERFRSLDRAACLLESSVEAMVESCVRLLELRGNETEGHGNRVTSLTVKLGERMGLSGRELIDLRRGAMLHDIGKLTLPDSLLQKTESLTEDDWKAMRTHTSRAHEALGPVRALQGALDVPLCHHERYDGSGYPGGLKGKTIPLAARIFAVVDVWDSLLSDRSYRRSWTPEKALEHVERGAGAQFDPDVVSAFSALLKEEPSLFTRPF